MNGTKKRLLEKNATFVGKNIFKNKVHLKELIDYIYKKKKMLIVLAKYCHII
jgi:hypothetical protein